jgi:hypothetical protein
MRRGYRIHIVFGWRCALRVAGEKHLCFAISELDAFVLRGSEGLAKLYHLHGGGFTYELGRSSPKD